MTASPDVTAQGTHVSVSGASASSVTFKVECRGTKPGDVVFVAGGHDALGAWDVKRALPLSTTAGSFPVWVSESISMPAAESVEYKFFTQQGDRTGKATWEEFPGNRKVSAVACALVTAASIWNDPNKTHIAKEATSLPAVTQRCSDAEVRTTNGTLEKAAQEPDDEPGSPANSMRQLAKKLESRDPMRKNFSQSLMCLDLELEEGVDEASTAEAAAAPQTPVEAAGGDDQPEPAGVDLATLTPKRRSVALKHISSFSALTEMAAAEEKTEARKSRKEPNYKPFNLDVPVVIVTSEVAPYSKTGGLGLVAASYSYEFPRMGHRTMVVSPKYKHFEGITWLGETTVVVNGKEESVKFWHKFESCGDDRGCDFIFVDHPAIERQGGLYNGDDGREYPDNLFRFTLLSMAAMEIPLILDIGSKGKYGDKVLFLANDWQAGLVPFYLSHKYRPHGCYTNARAIYVVHNLGYQGQYPHVPACHFFGVDQKPAADLEFGDCINLSKAALINADRVLTVSPNYTKEIQTKQGGFRLENYVRAKGDALRLGGILNGIDDVWNPETDKDIPVKYSVDNFQEGKAANKAALQRQLGLRLDPSVVLIGFVGRLTWQKGVDIMVQIVNWLMEDTGNGVTGRAQLIMMGNGEKQYADTLRGAEGAHPGCICGYVGFDPKVEHQMMAGCDLFLMPSRYEPCGLPQMYSQRYGTLPIVTATGGLVDSVKDVSLGINEATGFHMSHLSSDKMREVVYGAAELYLKRRSDFEKMQRTAMLQDFYWPQAMDEYEKAIDQTLYDPAVVR